MVAGKTERISTGYTPRPLQAELHRKLKRFNVLVCHRRFGKTVFRINDKLDRILRNPLKRPQTAYLAPTYGQAKRVAWDYFKEYWGKIPGAAINEADLRIDIPRPWLGDHCRVMLLGAENPMALKGLYLDDVTLDEYAEMNPNIWREVIRPCLSDRKGSATFIGTPKGRNNFCELYDYATSGVDPEWFGATYKASATGYVDPAELESAKRIMSEEEYEQEFECSFQAGLVGAYFSKELAHLEKNGKITAVPYDPMMPVDTYWDLGINDVSSIWFVQKHGREFRHVEYFESPDLNVPELCGIVTEKIKSQRCRVGKVFLPHDAQVRDLSTGKTRVEAFRKVLGFTPKVIPRVEDKLDSIHAARMVLPKCVFDKVKCERGIKALMNYQRKFDAKQNVFSPKPMHNWASNGADAFQQFSMAADDRDEDYRSAMPIEAETSYNPYG